MSEKYPQRSDDQGQTRAESDVIFGVGHNTVRPKGAKKDINPDGNKVALVTGGMGFIGSNLVNTLASDGWRVIAFDDLSFGTVDNLDANSNIYPVVGSVVNNLQDWMFDVDVVYHLAAKSSTKMHEEDPQNGARVNIGGFINVMERARKSSVKDVVYASSSTVYGNPDTPTGEDEPYDALAYYPASKIAREQYSSVYEHQGMNVSGARLYSTYQGYKHQEGHKGEHGNVISMFVDNIAHGTQPTVYEDGTQTRNFTHVSDVVSGLRAMKKQTGVYNICTNEAHDFNEILNAINQCLGTNIQPRYIEPEIDGEYIRTQEGDSSKLQSETNWEPKVDLVDGIRRVCEPYMTSD